jgi:hypothetical protein
MRHLLALYALLRDLRPTYHPCGDPTCTDDHWP